jgi:NAD(P)-dependent dehydrogenase (short-subunit alcohol dehydrogenase family)
VHRFLGRNVVVTGASRGIGAALAERLAAEGAALLLVARTLEAHDHLPGSLRETLARCERHGASVGVHVADLADEASRAALIPAALERFGGRIDVLVNNAAAAIYSDIRGFPLRRRRILFEVNVHCPVDLMQAVIPQMKARGEGWIVNLSSSAARYEEGRRRPSGVPRPDAIRTDIGMYAASKAALNRATVAFAAALAGTGVRVNCVEPRAAVLSEGSTALVGDDLDPSWNVESMEAMVEGALVLCDCGPERTGGVYDSLGLLEATGTPVMTLDGSRPFAGGFRPLKGPGSGA